MSVKMFHLLLFVVVPLCKLCNLVVNFLLYAESLYSRISAYIAVILKVKTVFWEKKLFNFFFRIQLLMYCIFPRRFALNLYT